MIELYDLRADYFQKAVSPLPSLSQPYIACCCIYPLIKAYLFWWTSLLCSRTRFVFFFWLHTCTMIAITCAIERESALYTLLLFILGRILIEHRHPAASAAATPTPCTTLGASASYGGQQQSAEEKKQQQQQQKHRKAASHRSEKYFASMFELLLSLARSLTLSPICCALSRSNSLLRAARSLNPRSRN